MNHFRVLFKKEWLEAVKSYRILWIPAFFFLLGSIQPLTLYYMEDILVTLGGLPEGAVLNFPELTAEQVFLDTLAQYSQVGVFAVILGFMGMFSNERKTGEAILVLAKPIGYGSYWFGKWTAASIVVTVGLLIGFSGAVYYIFVLFDAIELSVLLATAAVYLLWMSFVLTLTLLCSTLFKSVSLVAITSLIVTIAMTLTPTLLGPGAQWTPGGLIQVAEQMMLAGQVDHYSAIFVTIGLIGFMQGAGIYFLKKTDWVV
ncbi:hypothetical protein JCM19045_2494 [Bacillus sp. JCM 19045]|nr:hypothetical protein JCM19045_2494 [Bacillus sp. JCM 19045]